ncbi:MAG: hypothetical protein L0Y54_17250 [Sporichthyaceae bacterium]|nr:hypothetical protein [Sporichthyaceae bacterium]
MAISVIVTVLTPVASVATVFLLDAASPPAAILALYVCALTTGLLGMLFWQQQRYHREARYAAAMIPLRKAFESLGEASWTVVEGHGSEDAFLFRLQEALRFLAEAFSAITDTPCRACVKITVVPGPIDDALSYDGDVQIVTLARSAEVEERLRLEQDRVGNNTHFRRIFEGDVAYFFSNNLPALISKGYKNSHWDEQTIATGAFEYRATVVWPIARSRIVAQAPGRRQIIGFLCVDTLATDAFSETYDVPLGAAFAQALHLALHRFRSR